MPVTRTREEVTAEIESYLNKAELRRDGTDYVLTVGFGRGELQGYGNTVEKARAMLRKELRFMIDCGM